MATQAQPDPDATPVMTIDDLMAMERVRDPQISPDGRWVAYTVNQKDLEEDKSRTRIWMMSTEGGEPIPMTSADSSASRPALES